MRTWLLLLLSLPLKIFGATLTATPGAISHSPTEVTLKWEGVSFPTEYDWIGIYSPPDSYSYNWVGYVYVTKSETWSTGSGNITLRLPNMRMSYEFRYFHPFADYTSAISNEVTADKTYPTQIHLSLTNNPSEMRVLWVTGSKDYKPVVQYGKTSGSYPLQASGISNTYSTEHMCGSFSSKYFIDPGFIHNSLMTHLEPNTKYYYRVGNEHEGWSEEREFVSSPAPGQLPPNGILIGAYGDSGSSVCEGWYGGCEAGVEKTYQQITADSHEQQYNFLIHNDAIGVAHRWDQFFSEIEPFASRMPYMVCLGNHEYDYIGSDFAPSWGNYGDDSGGECGIPFTYRFYMPGDINSLHFNVFYSFDYGNIHVLQFSTEHNYTFGSHQYQWIENDLASVDRKKTPWVIVSFHRPMYTSIEHGDILDLKIADVLRSSIEPLLVKYNVDLALSAHIHAYERSCPLIGYECVPGAPVHVCIGMGGRDINLSWLPKPNWTVYRQNKYGWTRIHVVNDTALHMQYIINETEEIADDFWILK